MERLIDTDFAFGQNTEGLYVKRFQEIPDSFLQMNRELRDRSSNEVAGEYHKAASIPTSVVEKWAREGFDIHKESVRACLARLKAEGLDYFITTTKRV